MAEIAPGVAKRAGEMINADIHSLAVKKIRARGMIVHPKCETPKNDEGRDALVILAAFFAQEGCVAVAISGMEALSRTHDIEGFLESRVEEAYQQLRKRVLARVDGQPH